MMKTLAGIVLLLAIGFGVLYAISPVRPVAWQPSADAGLNNMFLKNETLAAANIINADRLRAPEDVVVSDEGIVYTGLENGDVVSFSVDTPSDIRVIANTGGRPLGVRLDKDNNIIVSDAIKGLISISQSGEITTLVKAFNNRPLFLVDHHDIAENGDIYFSDASARYGFNNYLYDFIESTATGSVYKYSPETGETTRLMSDLFFANGVALGPNDEYLLVAETGKSRIMKYQISGENQGQVSVFARNLPAMPDNISFNGEDTFWVGMVSLRDWRVESLAAFPVVRRVIGSLPMQWLEPKNEYGFVLGFNTYGKVVANYQSESKYTAITSAYEHDGKLYIGSLSSDGMAVLDR